MFKKNLRGAYNTIIDAVDWLHRCIKGKLYLPPRRLRDVGGDNLEDFEKTGQEFLQHFKKLCQIQPDANILEIGCGSGRIALPLTTFLSKKGSYTGVEVVAPSVKWCSGKITARFPNCTFIHADLYNKRYNPTSTIKAKDYHFPFENASFDFIYLTSVFTHLLPEDLEHYLSEIQRLLRANGKAFMTFFLLNAEQEKLSIEGKNQIHFISTDYPYQVRDKTVPESAVAYDETYLLDMLSHHGFMLSEQLLYGSWSGRKDGLSFQDVVIASLKNG